MSSSTQATPTAASRQETRTRRGATTYLEDQADQVDTTPTQGGLISSKVSTYVSAVDDKSQQTYEVGLGKLLESCASEALDLVMREGAGTVWLLKACCNPDESAAQTVIGAVIGAAMEEAEADPLSLVYTGQAGLERLGKNLTDLYWNVKAYTHATARRAATRKEELDDDVLSKEQMEVDYVTERLGGEISEVLWRNDPDFRKSVKAAGAGDAAAWENLFKGHSGSEGSATHATVIRSVLASLLPHHGEKVSDEQLSRLCQRYQGDSEQMRQSVLDLVVSDRLSKITQDRLTRSVVTLLNGKPGEDPEDKAPSERLREPQDFLVFVYRDVVPTAPLILSQRASAYAGKRAVMAHRCASLWKVLSWTRGSPKNPATFEVPADTADFWLQYLFIEGPDVDDTSIKETFERRLRDDLTSRFIEAEYLRVRKQRCYEGLKSKWLKEDKVTSDEKEKEVAGGLKANPVEIDDD